MICQCTEAWSGGPGGSCTRCGHPIVALMAASCQARMDTLWPGWRVQPVRPLAETLAEVER